MILPVDTENQPLRADFANPGIPLGHALRPLLFSPSPLFLPPSSKKTLRHSFEQLVLARASFRKESQHTPFLLALHNVIDFSDHGENSGKSGTTNSKKVEGKE